MALYDCVFLKQYYATISKYYSDGELLTVEMTISKLLSNRLIGYAHFDTLLLDTLWFCNCHVNVSAIPECLNLWRHSMENELENSKLPRSTFEEINNRNSPVINLVDRYRNLSGVCECLPISFIKNYYFLRQLLDDISDFMFDRSVGLRTFATVNGIPQTLATASNTIDMLLASAVEQFYKSILRLYKSRYIDRL